MDSLVNPVRVGSLALLTLHLKQITPPITDEPAPFPKESPLTHIIHALICGSPSVSRQLLRLCLPLRFSALHHAALTGTTELLSLLLEAQATVDVKDINGKKDT